MTQSKYTEINQYDCMRDNDTCFLLMKWTSKNSSYPKINKKVVLLQLPKKMAAFVQMSLISPQKWQNTWSCFYLRSYFFFLHMCSFLNLSKTFTFSSFLSGVYYFFATMFSVNTWSAVHQKGHTQYNTFLST